MGSELSNKLHNDYPNTLHYPEIFVDFLITRIIAVLSFVPNLAIFIVFIAKRKNVSFINSMAFHLSISCMLHSVSFLFPLIYNPLKESEQKICKVQSFLETTFDLTSLALTTSISYMAVKIFEETAESEDTQKRVKIIIASTWIFPLFFGIFVLIMGDSHSGTNLICFPRQKGIMIIYFCISLFVFILNMIFVYRLIREVKKAFANSDNYEEGLLRASYIKCFLFCGTQILTYGPFLVDIILKIKNLFKTEDESKPKELYPLWIWFKDLLKCATGLAFSIVYGYNPDFWEEIKAFFCCKESKRIPSITEEKLAEITLEDEGSVDPQAAKSDSIHLD
ncbi:MAG: G-protein coupled receptor [archaeon]|nr:G-protein coupled receptor [archaeon]